MGTENYVITRKMFVKYEGPEVEVLEIPEGVTNCKEGSFWESREQLRNCKKIIIPSTVNALKTMAKWGAEQEKYDGWLKALEEIVFLGDITSIPRNVWKGSVWDKISLKTITFCGKVEGIAKEAFKESKIVNVTFEKEVGNIDDSAFHGCSNLTNLIFEGNVDGIGREAFSGCKELKSLTFSGKVNTIGVDAFDSCSNLTSLTFAKGVDSIGKGAFSRCSNLTNLIFSGKINDIGAYGFNSCSNLTSITFSGDMNSIGKAAFAYCKNLTSITFPGDMNSIDSAAFAQCEKLTSITFSGDVNSIGDRAFSDCSNLTSLTFGGKVGSIGRNTFEKCSNLKIANEDGQFVFDGILHNTREVKDGYIDGTTCIDKRSWTSIPEGVNIIDEYSIFPQDSFVIPRSVTTIRYQNGKNIKELKNIGYAEEYFKTEQKLSGDGFLQLLKHHWAKVMSAEDWAYLYLFQTDNKLWSKRIAERNEIMEILVENEKDVNDIANGILNAMAKFGTKEHCLAAADYILTHMNVVSKENFEKFYPLFKEHNAEKALELWMSYMQVKTDVNENDPYGFLKNVYTEYYLDQCIEAKNGKREWFTKVRLADSEELAPTFLVKCAVIPYLEQKEGETPQIIPLAEQAAELLNTFDLQELVEKAHREHIRFDTWTRSYEGYDRWSIAFGRYASGKQIESFISRISDKYISRYEKYILLMSDTRESILWLDKNDTLDTYAKIRGTDVDTIKDTFLSDFDLDMSGKKEYDLGSKKIVVCLNKELKFDIYDGDKIIKSLPKRGADETLFKKASADFADIKKNVKKVVKQRNNILFEDFLSGKSVSANKWLTAYMNNPVLRHVAELIVWSQGNNHFILTEDAAIDCNGSAYEIDSKTEIRVAHPMEMEKNEVDAWRKYFTSNGFKQPFLQIWEPVVEPSDIKADRYKGCIIPISKLRNKKKHGIHVNYAMYSHAYSVYFDEKECDAKVKAQSEEEFEIPCFKFKNYNRMVNHIVVYLDTITIQNRILEDDTSIAALLENFTLAQITEFTNLAIENKSTNCTALLLEIKNRNFADYDIMEEFTLE